MLVHMFRSKVGRCLDKLRVWQEFGVAAYAVLGRTIETVAAVWGDLDLKYCYMVYA